MSDGSKDRGEVRPALSLSHKQVGIVRAHLAHHSEEPRGSTLDALGVWPQWDTIVAELEEKMVRETILGQQKTFDEATAGHEEALSEVDEEQLQKLQAIVEPPPSDATSPRLSLFALASLLATIVVEPDDFESECRKRNTTQDELSDDAVLWGILFESDASLAKQWEEELAFALQYLTRSVRLEDLPAKETSASIESPQPTEASSQDVASDVAPTAAAKPPSGGFEPPAVIAPVVASPPPVVAPQQVLVVPNFVPPSPPQQPATSDMSGIDSTAVGVRIDFDEPLPFEEGDFVPEPASDASSSDQLDGAAADEIGSTAFFQAGELLPDEAMPFEEAASSPAQTTSEVSHVALPFEEADFVPEPNRASRPHQPEASPIDEVGSTAFFQASDLDLKATPFEEVAPPPPQSTRAFSMRSYASLCVERRLWPGQLAQIYARYQIDTEQAKALDEKFRLRLEDPNELKAYYEHAAAHQKRLKEHR